jgi:phosphopantothenoylcysteine decarboxylase/phosphopantothenate--cysteine ligase
MHLDLVRAPDILASVASRPQRPLVVGFAAETENVEAYARDKLVRKKLDLIAANLVGEGLAFDCDDNALLVLWNDGSRTLDRAPKGEIARQLVELIAERYTGRRTSRQRAHA